MKKILLIIAIVFCIFQMVVLATAIDVGSPAIDRPSSEIPVTMFNLTNPANETGTITSVEIWANTNLSNCEVATFYLVSGSNYSTRDTHAIGSVTAGSKQTFSGLSISVQSGDYIGMYYTAGAMEKNGSGYDGVMYKGGDNIPCENETFTLMAGDTLSLYATGATPSGITWNTAIISKWNTVTISKWNGI